MLHVTRLLITAGALLLVISASAQIQRSASPAGAEVTIVSPAHGAVVSSPVRVQFALKGMEVAPAGTDKPASGHHHLIIDSCLPDLALPVPADDRHIHFGKGQTETVVELEPGKHTLTLLLADFRHVPHDPAVYSRTITITVE